MVCARCSMRYHESTACCLCHGTGWLADDAGAPLPCVCTPEGRELANGRPDAAVLAELESEQIAAGVNVPSNP